MQDRSAQFSDQPQLTRLDGGRTVLAGIGLPDRPGAFEIHIENGSISAIRRQERVIVEWMCLPPLADLHVHANRAFTLQGQSADSLERAIELTVQIFAEADEARYCAQATRFFERVISKGTMRVRTHADLDPATGLRAVTGTLEARAHVGERLQVEVIAFASSRLDPLEDQARSLLREAIAEGAEYLGAVPCLYPHPERSIDAILDLATELGVPLDLHLDEHLDPDKCLSGYLAMATEERGLQGKVTLSHGCAISTLPDAERRGVIENLAAAAITVISLPSTNLYLQELAAENPVRRGLAPVRELAAAGVEVRFATDNIQDVFYPYGSGDLLEIAALAAITAHVDDDALLTAAICDGKSGMQEGDEATFLLIPGTGLANIIADRPGRRIIVRNGSFPQ